MCLEGKVVEHCYPVFQGIFFNDPQKHFINTSPSEQLEPQSTFILVPFAEDLWKEFAPHLENLQDDADFKKQIGAEMVLNKLSWGFCG